jgi:hypothetical protein
LSSKVSRTLVKYIVASQGKVLWLQRDFSSDSMAIRICTLKNQHEVQIPKLALTESLACTEDLEAATFSMLKSHAVLLRSVFSNDTLLIILI